MRQINHFNMDRRKFIALTGVGAGMCLIPPALYVVAPDVQQYALKVLQKELYYLKLEPAGLKRYVADYFGATGNNLLSTLKWKTTYYMNLSWEKSDRIAELMKYYLLSSDFFINKMDESKEVHYLGLFNSYKSPVPNPYSFVLYPPNEIADV